MASIKLYVTKIQTPLKYLLGPLSLVAGVCAICYAGILETLGYLKPGWSLDEIR